MSQEPVKLSFQHSRGFEIGIDIFSIKELFSRQTELNHLITRPHRLSFYLLFYVTHGKSSHTIDFHNFHVEPHTLAIISKNQVQQFHPAFSLDGYLVVITEDFLQQALFDLVGVSSNLLFQPLTTQAHILRNAETVLVHVERLAEEYEQGTRDPQHVPILKRELGILLLKTERLRNQQLSESDQLAETAPRLLAFRDLLEKHFRMHWTAQQYAEALHFSKRTLGSLTRKHLNRSPKEVIDQRLVLEMKRLLAHSDLTIKEIAFQLGFEDPSNMNKFFRRVQGQSPRSFRQHLKPRR